MKTERMAALTLILGVATVLSASASPFVPITEGLNYHLDGADPLTWTVVDGRVSEWRSSHGRQGVVFANETADSRPFHDAAAFGNRGAIRFGFNPADDKVELSTRLVANKTTTNRTVFIVFHRYSAVSVAWTAGGFSTMATAKTDTLFGLNGNDAAAGFYGETYSRLHNTVTAGGYVWVNGVETSNPERADGNKQYVCPNNASATTAAICEPTLFAAELSESMVGAAKGLTGTIALGHYSVSKGNPFHGVIGEVLSYDRVLTTEEREWTTKCLQAKWMDTGATVVVDGNKTTVTVPVGVTAPMFGADLGSGMLVKRGGGTLELLTDGNAAKLDVLDGILDLAGTVQTFGTIVGAAVVTNSAAKTATLVVDAVDAAKLSPVVCGDVAVVKRGTGTVAVNANQRYSGGTTLVGGTFAAVSNVTPSSVAGLVLHLDASHRETMITNEQGQVTSWESSVGGVMMRNTITAAPNDGNIPLYDATAFAGRGGVRFGLLPDNTVTGTFLRADAELHVRTAFVVVQPNASQQGKAWSVFGDWQSSGVHSFTSASGGLYYQKGETVFFNNGWGAINGAVQYDVANEKDDHLRYSKLVEGSPHLIAAVAADGFDFSALTVGSVYMTTQKYYYWQGAIGEVIVYDRALEQNEIELIETQLMEKWGIDPAWVVAPYSSGWPVLKPVETNPLGAGQSLTVTGTATIDFDGMEQSLTTLTFDAGEAVAYPVLTLLGPLALNDVKLKLVCDDTAPDASQWLIRSAVLTGEFKSIEGGRVKYLPDGVKLAGNGGLILLLK